MTMVREIFGIKINKRPKAKQQQQINCALSVNFQLRRNAIKITNSYSQTLLEKIKRAKQDIKKDWGVIVVQNGISKFISSSTEVKID